MSRSLPDPDKPAERPEFMEAVVGFRSWRLIGGELYPVTPHHDGGAWWIPGENRAQCYKTGSLRPAAWVSNSNHAAPHKDCKCGFYGTYTRERAPNYSGSYWNVPYINVYGVAAFWGELKVHPFGLRAEYAQVLALEVPKDDSVDLRPVAKRYGVPIRTMMQLEQWVKENVTPLPESVIPEQEPQRSGHPVFLWSQSAVHMHIGQPAVIPMKKSPPPRKGYPLFWPGPGK